MKRSLNDGYDSRDVFISPSGIIAMINRAINRGYDFRDDSSSPVGIIATMINSTVNLDMIPEMILIILWKS